MPYLNPQMEYINRLDKIIELLKEINNKIDKERSTNEGRIYNNKINTSFFERL